MRRTVSILALAIATGACAHIGMAGPDTGGVPVYVTPAASVVTDANRAHPERWPHAASPAAMTDAATEAFEDRRITVNGWFRAREGFLPAPFPTSVAG